LPADSKISAGGAHKKRFFHESTIPGSDKLGKADRTTPIEEAHCQTNVRKSHRLKKVSISKMSTADTAKNVDIGSDSSSIEEE